jgi:uncharacterized membrane protein (UPF0127 family)
LLVRNETRGRLLASSAELADDSASRRKGLLGRRTLNPGEGLWIVPSQGIHTCRMAFPIDVLYLDRKKRVRKLRSEMVPWRISGCLTAHSVLELPAGTIADTGTRVGDSLQLEFLP